MSSTYKEKDKKNLFYKAKILIDMFIKDICVHICKQIWN
jgi:hypothetical protein